MSFITGFIGNLLVDSFFATLIIALVAAVFFIWLNRNDARVDRKYYDQSFKPERDLAANIFRGKEKEIDPQVALRAYSNPSSRETEVEEKAEPADTGPEEK